MTDVSWLRKLADRADEQLHYVDPQEQIADVEMLPDLARLLADTADWMNYFLGYDVAGWEGHLSIGEMNEKVRELLTRVASLNPDGT